MDSACTNYLNQEVAGLPRSMIWKSYLLNFLTYFQRFNLNTFHLGSKTAILKLNVAQVHSKPFYINGEVCLKVEVHDFLALIFGSLMQGNFWESLTPRLPLMQALCGRS